jgi:hypothetical protein
MKKKHFEILLKFYSALYYIFILIKNHGRYPISKLYIINSNDDK